MQCNIQYGSLANISNICWIKNSSKLFISEVHKANLLLNVNEKTIYPFASLFACKTDNNACM